MRFYARRPSHLSEAYNASVDSLTFSAYGSSGVTVAAIVSPGHVKCCMGQGSELFRDVTICWGHPRLPRTTHSL